MKKYSFKAIAALFLVVIMCLSFIPAAFAVMNDGYSVDTTACAHDETKTTKAKVEATCTEDGIEACEVCDKCGAVVNAGALVADNYDAWKNGDGKIKALDHDFSGKVVDSFDASGHYFKCSREGCTAISPVEKHKFVNHVCSVCNYVEPLFDVKFDGDKDKIKNEDEKVDAGKEDYSVTITPKDGYTAKITGVKMGGAVLPKEEHTVDPNPPKINYELSPDEKTITFKVPITGDVEITVEANGIEYNVTFDLAGGSWPAGYSQKTTKHTYGDPTPIEDEDPTKAGYTFKGWKVNSNTTPEKVAIPADTAPGDVKLTAAWEEKTVGITVVNGTIKDNATTIKASDKLQITAKDLEGKRFVGWKVTQPTDEELAGHVTITSKTASPAMVSVDATFTDAGNPVEITAEYNVLVTYSYKEPDGTGHTFVYPTGGYAPGAQATLFDEIPPAPTGQAFKCWTITGTDEYQPGATYTMGETGVTFEAVYVPATFEVSPEFLEFIAEEGDTKAPDFQPVTVKNTGTSAITITLPKSTASYIVRDSGGKEFTVNTVSINPGENYKFKVRPADPANKYTKDDYFYDTLIIEGDGGQKQMVYIDFEVTKPLKVKINPETLEKNCGESASFTANPTGGAGGYSYQWQVKEPGKDSYTDLYDGRKLCTANTSECACIVSGANSRTLTLNYAVCKVDGYKFRCVVEDADGNTVTSGGASLRVKIRGQKEYDKYNYQCTHCGEISPKIKTGDESMPILWASLAGVSLVALAVGAVYYFRKKKKNT